MNGISKGSQIIELSEAGNIHPLSIDLQREDLNTVVAKLNEVINYLNK